MARVPDSSTGTPSASGVGTFTGFTHDTFIPTDGWFVALGCTVGVLTANTRFGKITFGILTVALIYQISQWIQGK